jgi:hypothetical protein
LCEHALVRLVVLTGTTATCLDKLIPELIASVGAWNENLKAPFATALSLSGLDGHFLAVFAALRYMSKVQMWLI